MVEDFKDGNRKTIEAYDFRWSQYQIGDDDIDLPQEYYDELDWLVAGVDKSAKIFEIGSGPGRDALYWQSRGYHVDCSEAAPAAVKVLKERGLSAQKLNVLTDELPHGYQLILALGVVPHFSPRQLQLACDKIFAALDSPGRFGFNTVEGQTQEWYQDGLGRTRYISHLPEAELRIILKQSGFDQLEIRREAIDEEVDGLSVVAFRGEGASQTTCPAST